MNASLLARLAIAVVVLVALQACQVLDLGRKDIGAALVQTKSGTEALSVIRSEYGLSPLRADAQLENAALQQATFMAQSGKMEHTTGRGRDFASRVRENQIRGVAAENIAYGRFDPGHLFNAWMNSSGHRRNMLDKSFTRFGLASVEEANGSGRRYWALVLAE